MERQEHNQEMLAAPSFALVARAGGMFCKRLQPLQPVTQIANKNAGCNRVTAVTAVFLHTSCVV
jgi:hypothetical protein